MKIILIIFCFTLFKITLNAQVTEEWVARYNGPGNDDDMARAIAVDNKGNVYVTGSTTIGIGGGGLQDIDYATIKYNSAGVIQWLQRYDGTFNGIDIATSIAVDNEGNVYVTGSSRGIGTDSDIATIKYDSSGAEQWVNRYNGPGNSYDGASAIAVDSEGNVYVTGSSVGNTIGFDFVKIKYNSSGVELWVRRYDGPTNGNDVLRAIAIDSEDNIYVTGSSEGNGTSADFATIKYNSSGVEQWIQRYNGPANGQDVAAGIAVDSEGNVYVTGYSDGIGTDLDYATIKYNSSGVEQWIQRYNGPANGQDVVAGIAVDNEANVYVTGYSNGVGTMQDFTTIKYNSSGIEQWVQRYNGSENAFDAASAIALDNIGNVYVTGSSYSGIETRLDYATIKYNSLGIEQWRQSYNGPGNDDDRPAAIAIDNEGNVYVTGNSWGGLGTRRDYSTIKYSQGLRITKPTSDDKFIAAEKDTIRWTGGQPGQFLEINYSDDNGVNFELIDGLVPADSGYYIWDIPTHILSTKVIIQIEDQTNSEISAESETFRIKPLVLTRFTADSNYYEFRKDRDQWSFSNSREDMWPQTWYQQFDYQGIDPFTGKQYSQIQAFSTFKKADSDKHVDWISWVNTFSVDACYWSANSVLPIYRNNAVYKWNSQLIEWRGSCFGIAIGNALAFAHREQFMTRYPNFPSFNHPIDVTSNNAVKKVINELFAHQSGEPHKTYFEQIALKKTPKETLIELIEYFTEDNPQVRTLGFLHNIPKSGRHELIAYGLEKDQSNPDVFYVKVYDNSYPTSTNKIKIDTSANGGVGSWSSPDWPGWGGKKWIYLTNPASEYLTNPILPKTGSEKSLFFISEDVLEVRSPVLSSIRIKDISGNLTGYYNDSLQIDIPDSYPLLIANGAETPPYGYSVPTNNYSIILDEFTEDTLEVFLFTGNKIFLYEREGATQTQTDRLFFDGGVSVTNPDSATKNISLLNLISETTHEKLFVASSINLVQNDSVKVENPDSNTIKLVSYGSAKSYEIELNYVTANEIGRFVDNNIPLQENSSHILLPEWTDLTNSQLIILVDIGNNGTIDDTLRLDNKVTGIDYNNNSLMPDKYYLAQNYPNPFNPSTTISWQTPVGSHQTLKIYDVLGNEVATLVNEYREAGRHSVTFDASSAAGGLASGMYLYRLQSGNYSETKKMLMLK